MGIWNRVKDNKMSLRFRICGIIATLALALLFYFDNTMSFAIAWGLACFCWVIGGAIELAEYLIKKKQSRGLESESAK